MTTDSATTGKKTREDTDLCRLTEQVARLRDERDTLRAALEQLFLTSEGYGEEFDTLLDLGLLVEAPATEEFREEWGDETKMYVWSWSGLAGGGR